MYGLKKRRLEKDKLRWYKDHGQVPPSLTYHKSKSRKKPQFDLDTYTDTVVLDFEPSRQNEDPPMSYWDVPDLRRDGGMEPEDFSVSFNAMKETKIIPPNQLPMQKCHKAKECYTPYQNDVASFEAFDSTLKELKRQQKQIALEMERVDNEWNRPPIHNWFAQKGKTFSKELHRAIQLERRNAEIERYERRVSMGRPTSSPRRYYYE